MMAEPHASNEVMEMDYDSDETFILDEQITSEEGEGEAYDDAGSRTPSIHELEFDDLRSPHLGRRRAVATPAPSPPPPPPLTPPLPPPQLDSGEESEVDIFESPEIGRRRPATQDADPEEEEEEEEEVHVLPQPEATPAAAVAARAPAAGAAVGAVAAAAVAVAPAAAAAVVAAAAAVAVAAAAVASAEEAPSPAQEEPQHSPSSPPVHDDPQPSPAPPPPVPPDNSHTHQQPTPSLSSEQPQPGTSGTPPQGATPSVEASASNPPEAVLCPPAVAGSSTPADASSNSLKRKPKGAAPAEAVAESEDEGQTCPICFEPWSNMGNHRLASLKCGHLFGLECINKWLSGTVRHKGRCPQCNAKAAKKDVRVIYAKSLKVQDTAEKERIMRELEKEREEKRRLDVEHAQTRLKYELKTELVVKLQKELKELKALAKGTGFPGGPSSQGGQSGSYKNRLVHSGEWLDVCRLGGCRVMAYNEWLGMLVVSMPSQVGMFPGYGVKKINLLEVRMDHYVPLHQKQIRDLAFNPVKHDLLLSVGMDRLVKITNICSNASVAHFTAPAPLWCCCWSTTESNMFYVGTTSGSLQQYDTRNTSGPVGTIELPGSGPVVSMTYIHPGPESSLTWGGLLVARLKSCFFVEVGMPGEAQSHLLPLDGTFNSVSCDAKTCHVLVSCRPSRQHPHARHAVCLLQQVDSAAEGGGGTARTVIAYPVHTFQGGTTQKVLTRSLLARPPITDSCPVVYASDESTRGIYVWDLSTMTCLQQLRHTETVLDLLQVIVGNTPALAALTEKGVWLYRWANHQ